MKPIPVRGLAAYRDGLYCTCTGPDITYTLGGGCIHCGKPPRPPRLPNRAERRARTRRRK